MRIVYAQMQGWLEGKTTEMARQYIYSEFKLNEINECQG